MTSSSSSRAPALQGDEAVMSHESPLRRRDFLVGFATAQYQDSGAVNCPTNNWSDLNGGFERVPGAIAGEPADATSFSGRSCDSWNNIVRDIGLLKSAGANAYRFSIEWSRVQPSPSTFDGAVIAHYHELLDALLAAGITPMVTLLHFTVPMWFQRLGAFERSTNIPIFVAFAARMFEEYHSKVRWWCTINEPAVLALSGYILGQHAPGHKGRFVQAKEVILTQLAAHCEVYARIKRMPGGSGALVGIVHNALTFESTAAWLAPASVACRILTNLCHVTVTNYFAREGRGLADFWGLNFYSRALISWSFQPIALPGEVLTSVGWATNPASFYRAIKDASLLGLPIVITENGMPEEPGKQLQVDFMRQYLPQLIRAMNEGVDVRGYFWWTLISNFEWNLGFMKTGFGLWGFDPKTGAIEPNQPAIDYFRAAFEKSATT
jgi:beta-glucosidase